MQVNNSQIEIDAILAQTKEFANEILMANKYEDFSNRYSKYGYCIKVVMLDNFEDDVILEFYDKNIRDDVYDKIIKILVDASKARVGEQ